MRIFLKNQFKSKCIHIPFIYMISNCYKKCLIIHHAEQRVYRLKRLTASQEYSSHQNWNTLKWHPHRLQDLKQEAWHSDHFEQSSGSQTCPGVPPALHILYVSFIYHTWFNSSAHRWRLRGLKWVCQIQGDIQNVRFWGYWRGLRTTAVENQTHSEITRQQVTTARKRSKTQ